LFRYAAEQVARLPSLSNGLLFKLKSELPTARAWHGHVVHESERWTTSANSTFFNEPQFAESPPTAVWGSQCRFWDSFGNPREEWTADSWF
jgi:hypothetical protein